jgi:hypothetical protein
VSESNFKDELEEVWVPKDVGELKGLLLAIQNKPGKKILKHKIQQVIKGKKRHDYWHDADWDDWGMEIGDWPDWIDTDDRYIRYWDRDWEDEGWDDDWDDDDY